MSSCPAFRSAAAIDGGGRRPVSLGRPAGRTILASLLISALAWTAACSTTEEQQAPATGTAATSQAPPSPASAGPGGTEPPAADPGTAPPANPAAAGDDAADPSAATPPVQSAADGDAAVLQGDSGVLGGADSPAMPDVVGLSVADSKVALSDQDIRYTDPNGAPVSGGDNDIVCRQSPAPGEVAGAATVVLAIAAMC